MAYPTLPLVEWTEWTYPMRRAMQEIVPGVYLGPYSAASRSKLENLLFHGITHIICVRKDIESHIIKPNFVNNFKYLVLDITDSDTENIINHFQDVKQFVDSAVKTGGNCLIHGNAGICRSAALVVAYVMQTYGLSAMAAFSIVQRRRFCVNINEGFMAQLVEFEPIYKALEAKLHVRSAVEQRAKRSFDEFSSGDTNNRRTNCDDQSVEPNELHEMISFRRFGNKYTMYTCAPTAFDSMES